MTMRSRRLDASLGNSWADENYSDDVDSIGSTGDVSSEEDISEPHNEGSRNPAHIAPRKKRHHLSQSTPSTPYQNSRRNIRASESNIRETQPLQTSHFTPRLGNHRAATPAKPQPEPAFIMPTMGHSPSQVPRNSASRISQARLRQTRQVSQRAPDATVPSQPRKRNSPRTHKTEPEEVSPWHYVGLFWSNLILPLLKQFLDIFSYAFRHFVKPVLGVVVGFGILYMAITALRNTIYANMSDALLTPICSIPGSSYIIPFCAIDTTPQANFEDLINIQGRFEDIIEASKDTSTLPSTIKNSEIAIRDLRMLVKFSQLPSRNQLETEFGHFIETAGEASRDLSRYNSRIGATIDRVLATNSWTMNVLHGIAEQDASIGSIGRVLNTVTGAFLAPPPTLQQRIFDQYLLHVGKNKEEITILIEQAQALLQILDRLDEQLTGIHEISLNDDRTITIKHEELLSHLWTKFGGNRSNRKANEQSLNLLKNIDTYRKKAVVHVSSTLLKLQEIQGELENLREGVAAPEVLGYRNEVPLTYYLDVIGKGVERLSAVRGESRRIENENIRRQLGTAEEVKELPGPVVYVSSK